jgi:hypothetical protein
MVRHDRPISGELKPSKAHHYIAVEFRTLFPTSLCGVLVFGCALPPARSRSRPPPTHNLLTHNLLTHKSPTHNLLTHTQLAHSHLALGDRLLHFAWQTRRLVTSTFTLRGRCGTW